MRPFAHLFTAVSFACLAVAWVAPAGAQQERDWVEKMKLEPRGPFSQIRWFCKDGTVLPPRPEACIPHGGGRQHGEWSEKTMALRERGYYIANVMASIEAEAFLAQENVDDVFAQILLEQFLIAIDDGWILRRARYYRGALQEEAERRNALRLLLAMAEKPDWLIDRYLLLRSGARLLPHGHDTDTVTLIRQTSSDLALRDPSFQQLRNKIHIKPQAADADAVEEYAQTKAPAELVPDYELLVSAIRKAYAPSQLGNQIESVRKTLREVGDFDQVLGQMIEELEATDQISRFHSTARLLALLRDRLLMANRPSQRLALLDLSVSVEAEHFIAGNALRDIKGASRLETLSWLRSSLNAIYGAGLISARQRDALATELTTLGGSEAPLQGYKAVLDYAARVPGWGSSTYAFNFGEPVTKFLDIEPLAVLFIQDQLRGSAMSIFAQIVDVLIRDANQLAGVRTELFGKPVTGLRVLNPGVARGHLQIAPDSLEVSAFLRNGIYILPETVAELPPIAGILTAGEGNPLSHVQLLARNLGIPNVAVDDSLLPALQEGLGQVVRMGSTAAGSVSISPAPDETAIDTLHGQVRIIPDLAKLDLAYREFASLAELSAEDSGRIVGPKAAKLAELKRHYPEAVARGIVIPFGEFRALLSQPKDGTPVSMFEWMVAEYDRVGKLADNSPEQAQQTEALRAEIEAWILKADPGEQFRNRLSAAMRAVFGPDGSYGVFVRSDTNVEDLPGFTGAGLNLTLPNVIGETAVFDAIKRVWASPFSARAFAWRQALMDEPVHVYPAILLLETVPGEKSGVMVTQDVDSGNSNWLSVAVNEGVGGAVDGQPAESLRININNGDVRLLAQASAPWRRTVSPAGGVVNVRTSRKSTVLRPAEVTKLIEFARNLPERFPPIIDDQGNPTPADIEFGFLDGELKLFQIRPFLESVRAKNSSWLTELDSSILDLRGVTVRLDEPLL